MDQVIQVGGALLILVAFVAAQLGRLDPQAWSYLVLNVGSAILTVDAYLGREGSCCSRLPGRWFRRTAWCVNRRGAHPQPLTKSRGNQ